MKQYKIKKYNNDFVKSKGIYVIVGLCVIAAGIFSWIGVNNQLSQLEEENQQNVEQKLSGIEKEETLKSPPPSPPSQQSSQQSTTSNNSQKQDKISNSQAVSSVQSFAMPVDGKITNKFSNGELFKSPTLNDWRTHNGVDIDAKVNTEVKAVAEAVVKEVNDDAMWGTLVVLELKDKTICRYANLNKTVKVKVGQKVKEGDVIGTVGKTATAEIKQNDHLHFEVIKNDKYVDPEQYFGKK